MERLSIEEREERAFNALQARQQSRVAKALDKSHYLDDPNVKTFNKVLRASGLAKARKSIKLESVEKTAEEINDYFDLCDTYSQLPSIKSLCLYLGISVSTYHNYLNDVDSEYGELFRAAIDYIHSIIEGGALNNKINPVAYMFTASNFYGMKDTKQVDITAVAPSQHTSMSSRESLTALRQEVEKQKESEKVKEAVYVDKSGEISEQ